MILCRGVAVGLIFGLLVASAPPVDAQGGLALWPTGSTASSTCRGYSGGVGGGPFSKVIKGYDYPHAADSAAEFIDGNVRLMNATAAGRSNDSALAARLLTAAQGDAFTRLDFETPGGASPSFLTGTLITNVAFSVAALRANGALSADQMSVIDTWVRKLIKNTPVKFNNKAVDHRAILASSKLAWGAAIGDATLYGQGLKALTTALKGLNSGAVFADDVRHNNEAFHHIMIGAAIAYRNGTDVFSAKIGRVTLHQATAFHAAWVVSNGTAKVRTSGEPNGAAQNIFRAQGFAANVAWVPIYLSLFPNSGAATEVRALDKVLRRQDGAPFWGLVEGIHSGCLFGRGS